MVVELVFGGAGFHCRLGLLSGHLLSGLPEPGVGVGVGVGVVFGVVVGAARLVVVAGGLGGPPQKRKRLTRAACSESGAGWKAGPAWARAMKRAKTVVGFILFNESGLLLKKVGLRVQVQRIVVCWLMRAICWA